MKNRWHFVVEVAGVSFTVPSGIKKRMGVVSPLGADFDKMREGVQSGIRDFRMFALIPRSKEKRMRAFFHL